MSQKWMLKLRPVRSRSLAGIMARTFRYMKGHAIRTTIHHSFTGFTPTHNKSYTHSEILQPITFSLWSKIWFINSTVIRRIRNNWHYYKLLISLTHWYYCVMWKSVFKIFTLWCVSQIMYFLSYPTQMLHSIIIIT